jgi:hypothetical protein
LKIFSGTPSFFQNHDKTRSKIKRCATATEVMGWHSFIVH